MLFVHGACSTAWCWDEHFLDFFVDKGYRAVALSLRGHGASSLSKPLKSCSIADYVDDVHAVVVKLGSPAPQAAASRAVPGRVVRPHPRLPERAENYSGNTREAGEIALSWLSAGTAMAGFAGSSDQVGGITEKTLVVKGIADDKLDHTAATDGDGCCRCDGN